MVKQLIFFLLVQLSFVQPSFADEFLMGISTHAGLRRDSAAQIHSAVHDLGSDSLRDEIYWTVLAPASGVLGVGEPAQEVLSRLDPLRQSNKCLLLLLGYGHPKWIDGLPDNDAERRAFLAYASFAASVYDGKLCAIEVWNEWNIGAGRIGERLRYGSAADYVRLVAAVVPVLRAIKPEVPVVIGALSDKDLGWISEVLQGLSSLNVAVDGVSVHPYVFSDRNRNPEAVERWIEMLDRSVLQSYGKKLPVYVTEIGWPNFNSGLGTDYLKTARYLVETYVRLRSIDSVVGVWWYGLKDKGIDRNEKENGFGLMTYSGQLKPAGVAFGRLARFWGGCRYSGKGVDGGEYVYLCPDGVRHIFLSLDSRSIESSSLRSTGCEIVDLVSGDVVESGPAVSANWLGRHVGVSGRCHTSSRVR